MANYPAQWSRRKFLFTAAGAGAAVLCRPFAALAVEDIDPRVAAIVAATMGIDTHNHINVPLAAGDGPGPDIDLAGELRKSGLTAVCMTFAVDYQELKNPGDAYERFKNGLTAMDAQLKRNGMQRALNLADLNMAHERKQPVVIQSVEGGHFLEGHIERLEEAYNRGLRHLTLLHDHDAPVPLGDVYTNAPQWGGLTAFGAAAIKECNRLGILVDMAHANEETLAMSIKTAAHPIMISHTGLDTELGQNAGMANMMQPRLISKKQAKMVADAGGVIGVWTHLADSPLEYAQHLRALVAVVGADHVCIGTDTKLTPPYMPAGGFGHGPDGPKPNGHPNEPHGGPMDKGHGGPGSGKRPGERTNEAWAGMQTGFYYAVVDAMLKTGFTAEEIGKIGGGNFCRVFDAATAGR